MSSAVQARHWAVALRAVTTALSRSSLRLLCSAAKCFSMAAFSSASAASWRWARLRSWVRAASRVASSRWAVWRSSHAVATCSRAASSWPPSSACSAASCLVAASRSAAARRRASVSCASLAATEPVAVASWPSMARTALRATRQSSPFRLDASRSLFSCACRYSSCPVSFSRRRRSSLARRRALGSVSGGEVSKGSSRPTKAAVSAASGSGADSPSPSFHSSAVPRWLGAGVRRPQAPNFTPGDRGSAGSLSWAMYIRPCTLGSSKLTRPNAALVLLLLSLTGPAGTAATRDAGGGAAVDDVPTSTGCKPKASSSSNATGCCMLRD